MPISHAQRQQHWAATLSLVFPADHTDFNIPDTDANIASAGHVLLARSCPLNDLTGLDASDATDLELAMYADNPGVKGVDSGLIAAVAERLVLGVLLLMRSRELPLSKCVVITALLVDTPAARAGQPLITLAELRELITEHSSPEGLRPDPSLQPAIAASCLLARRTGDTDAFPLVLARITERIGSVFPPFDGAELSLLQRFWMIMTEQAPEGALLSPVITFAYQLYIEEDNMTEFCIGLLLSVFREAPAAVLTYLLDYLHCPRLTDYVARWVAEVVADGLDDIFDASAREELARAVLFRATAELLGREGGRVVTLGLYQMSIGFAQDAHTVFEDTLASLLMTGTCDVVERTFEFLKPFSSFGPKSRELGEAGRAAVDRVLRRAASSDRADPILVALIHECEQTDAVRLSGRAALVDANVYRLISRAPVSIESGISSCAICRTAIHQRGFKTPCDHQFHRVCITIALLRSNLCPICRIPVMGV